MKTGNHISFRALVILGMAVLMLSHPPVQAGTSPEGIDPRTIDVLAHFNIPTQGLRSKSVFEFKHKAFDFVITLCGKARQECGHFPLASVSYVESG